MMRLARPVLALAVLASLGGCARKDEAPVPAAALAAPRKPVVGAILMQQDQFFRLNEAGMREAAEAFGADLRVQNAAGALDREIGIVETFMTQGVDAILVSPLSATGSVPALQRAHERGIRIVIYNNSLAADFPVFSIASDQAGLGAATGREVRGYVNTRLGGKARIAVIGFASQLPEQGGARMAGFKSLFTDLPDVEFVAEQDAWEAPQAATVVTQLLAKNPDVVWAANEGGTVGAVTAVLGAGKAGKVVVYGTDISTQLVEFMLSGDDILQAVTAQAPVTMGQLGVRAAIQAIRGEAMPRSTVLAGAVYTRENQVELLSVRKQLEDAAK